MPYEPRKISFIGRWELNGGTAKVYHIAHRDGQPGEGLLEAARATAERVFPDAYGFIGIHEGNGATVLFVDWWADENELHHRLFILDDVFREAAKDEFTACVWDLQVICHERESWVRHVMDRSDIEGYLQDTIEGLR